MNSKTVTPEPEDDFSQQVDEALIAELEENLPPADIEAWRTAFLRERIE